MTTSEIFSLFQTLVTIVALIYVAQQTKHLRQSIQGATYQSILNSITERMTIYIEHPELAEIYSPEHYSSPEKTPQETSRKWMAIWLSDTYENIFLQHEEGTLSNEVWQGSWKHHIPYTYRTTILKDLWPKIKQGYNAKYRKFIDEELAKVTQQPA